MIPLHACNDHVMGHVMDIITYITIRSEVSFRSGMHNCFKAVVKQKGKKIRSHTLVARGIGLLGGTVRQCL